LKETFPLPCPIRTPGIPPGICHLGRSTGGLGVLMRCRHDRDEEMEKRGRKKGEKKKKKGGGRGRGKGQDLHGTLVRVFTSASESIPQKLLLSLRLVAARGYRRKKEKEKKKKKKKRKERKKEKWTGVLSREFLSRHWLDTVGLFKRFERVDTSAGLYRIGTRRGKGKEKGKEKMNKACL